MKLVFIHLGAKAGGRVSVPGIVSGDIPFGSVVDVPKELVDAALKSGHWEKQKSSKKNTTTLEASDASDRN